MVKIADYFIKIRADAASAKKEYAAVTALSTKFNVSTRRLVTTMRELGLTMNKSGNLVKNQFGKSLAGASKNQGNLIKQTSKFRAEMLSLLFVGMAISGFFQSYVSEAMNMSGATELLRTSIGAAVLSFMDLLGLDGVIDWLVNFADENEALAGGLTLGGFAAGKLVTSLGMLSLIDIAKVKDNLAGMGKWLKNISLWKVGVGLIALALIFQGFKLLLGENNEGWERMKGLLLVVSGVALGIFVIFGGWIPLVIAIGAAVIVWASRFEPVKDALGWIWDKLSMIWDIAKSLFSGGVGALSGGFKSLFGLAEGGIVTRPTAALVGEAGPEAVIPLNKLANFAPQVTVNASVASNVDISRLANSLSSVYSDQLRSQGIIRRTV